MKTVEEYQEQTERRWRRLAKGKEILECGWCAFNSHLGGSVACSKCPVPRVFGQLCVNIPQVDAFFRAYAYSAKEQQAAQVVLDLAIEHREELVAAARAILEEVGDGQEAV